MHVTHLPPARDLALERRGVRFVPLYRFDAVVDLGLGRNQRSRRLGKIVDGELPGGQDHVEVDDVDVSVPQNPLVNLPVDIRRIRRRVLTACGYWHRDSHLTCHSREIAPEVAQHAWRRVLALSRM